MEAAASRARILDAAVKLIAREGLDDVRIARIAREAGVSASLVHRPGSPHDDWMLWVELWRHTARHPELRATAARVYARMHAWFAEAIVAAGFAVADLDRTVDRLLALIDGYGIRTLTEDPAMPLERARAEVWAAIEPELQRNASR